METEIDMDRRKFLGMMGLSGLAALLPFSFGATPKKETTGTYTVKSPSDYSMQFTSLTTNNIELEPGTYNISTCSNVEARAFVMQLYDPLTQTIVAQGADLDHRFSVGSKQWYEIRMVAKDFKRAEFSEVKIIKVG